MEGAQDEFAVQYVILTQEILCDKQLNAIEKLILARITGFSEFFEASDKTAEFLGTTELVVQRAKRKLVKLGYIQEKANTGRGKVYEFCFESYIRPNKKVTSDITKKSHQTLQKSNTYNKNKINIKYYNKETPKNEAVENSNKKVEYGNPKVNALMEIWDAEVGVVAKRDQANRRAAWLLINHEGFEGAQRVVSLIGQSIRKGDRYAPQIGSFRDLWGKYGKLDKLLVWAKRNDAIMQAEQPVYPYTNHEDDDFEISDEEREKVLQQFKEQRKRLFGGEK